MNGRYSYTGCLTMNQELIWLNGEIGPMGEARLGVEDRGFQFADGVYEVVRLYGGRPFTLREHLERLERSAAGINLKLGTSAKDLASEVERFVSKTGVADGMIYLQATRGVAPRNHVFPDNARPTILFYARPLPPLPKPGEGEGAKLWSVPDERWKRCWVKSIALLPNVLAKNVAIEHGADEAVFVEDGLVNECSASNFYAVVGGKVVTHPVGPKVLPGITRQVLLEVAKDAGATVVERPPSEAEAMAAEELFITSTTREISWVGQWNGKPVGGGRCGPVTRRLHEALRRRVLAETTTTA